MNIFWENFFFLCEDKGTKPLRVVTELGIASGSITKWKNGSIPSQKNLQKLAGYFNVTSEYFFVSHAEDAASPATEHTEDPLWKKISQLDEMDRAKLEAYADGLLTAEKYQTFAKIKNA